MYTINGKKGMIEDVNIIIEYSHDNVFVCKTFNKNAYILLDCQER